MELLDIIRYIIKNYPYPEELSKARLNKIIYLIDWRSSIVRCRSITNISWIYNNYGPYVTNIEDAIREDPRFDIALTTNYYGSEKSIIRLLNDEGFEEPFGNDKEIIDFVIEKTKRLNYSDFLQLVYSTYPIINSSKGSYLNLPELAKDYEAFKKDLLTDET